MPRTTRSPKAGWSGLPKPLLSTIQRPPVILIGLLFLAVVVRLASALYFGDVVSAQPGVYDQISYDSLAR